MPATNLRAIEKAPTLACDAVIFDLEDAVGENEQEDARQNLLFHVKGQDFSDKERIIRVSEVGHPNHDDDLQAAIQCEPDAILLPKIEEVKDIEKVDTVLKVAAPQVQLWIMIESPKALMNLPKLVSMAKFTRLSCLVVGPNDLARTTGAKMQLGRAAMAPWLMQIVAAARAYDLCVLDGVFNQFRDPHGLETECEQGAAMGFDGKTLIHPNQIEAANRCFGPQADDLARAKRIVELFQKEENKGRGAVQMNGEMVEPLHLEMAQKLLSAFDEDIKI